MSYKVATDPGVELAAEPAAIEEVSPSEQTNLLRTKLFIPPIHARAIARSALLHRLDQLENVKLILVTAPAGFGKTTLVAKWLADKHSSLDNNRGIWLSLEEADNDLARFWKYLIAAMQTVDPCVGLNLMGLLGRPALPPPETWLPSLLNDLEQVSGPRTIVLDDYHCIHTRAIHHSLNHLIQHLPPTITIAIITRADPPIPLARLRVQDCLAEIRAADLLFSSGEIEAYLNGTLGLDLTAEDLDLLAQRTKGWPAGIQLAARSLLGCADGIARSHQIRQFSGSNEFILNYLLEEVLQQQPPAVRDFLLRTSILSRLTAPLCAAVTDLSPEKADQTLSALCHDDLFISPLDDARQWYRYHPLLSEALATKLRNEHPQQWEDGHRQALNWLVAHDQHEAAIGHALAVREYDIAADIIEGIGDATWSTGDVSSPLRWLAALPKAALNNRVSLRLLYAWALVLNSRIDEAETLWREVGEEFGGTPAGYSHPARGRWAALGGAIAHLRERPQEAIHLCKQALELLPPEESLWRAVSQLICGSAYQSLGQAAPAVAIYQEMIDLCASKGIQYLGLLAQANLIEVLHTQGRLYEAQAHCERVRVAIPEPSIYGATLDSHACVCLGRLYYERNDLQSAERLVTDGINRIWPDGQVQQTVAGHLLLARIHQLNGKQEASRRQLETALNIALQTRQANVERAVRATTARLALFANSWDAVKSWQAGSGVSANDLSDFTREYEHRILSEILIAQGAFQPAETLLSRCRAAAARGGRGGSDLPLALLQAVALLRQNRPSEAEAVARGVLSLAESQNYARTILDMGEPVIELLRRPNVRSHAPAYVDRLCAFFDQENERTHPAKPLKSTNGHQSLPLSADGQMVEIDALTPRESEILTLIAGGASNQEIADCLVLSVGTVKGHINHIFSKLDVHSRTAAVARARNYRLIASD